MDNLGPSLFGVLLLPNFNTTVEAVESAYDEQVARMIAEGVSEDELAKAVNQIRSGEIFALESVFALAESVQSANFYYDNPNDVFASIDRFEQVTSADIQRVLAQYLAPKRDISFMSNRAKKQAQPTLTRLSGRRATPAMMNLRWTLRCPTPKPPPP
ncbi:MAG UNVERIFIED_CONTAM: hypothetical protein LVT10_13665 [Anaerolineae bacterium]